MSLNEFTQKKYGNKYFELKTAIREFNQNQKNKQKYFMLKKKNPNSYELMILKGQIIW